MVGERRTGPLPLSDGFRRLASAWRMRPLIEFIVRAISSESDAHQRRPAPLHHPSNFPPRCDTTITSSDRVSSTTSSAG